MKKLVPFFFLLAFSFKIVADENILLYYFLQDQLKDAEIAQQYHEAKNHRNQAAYFEGIRDFTNMLIQSIENNHYIDYPFDDALKNQEDIKHPEIS